MLSLFKSISPLVLLPLFLINCSQNDTSSNPLSPVTETPATNITDSNPYEGTYSGTCSIDGNKLKLVFTIDDDYSITGSETWPSSLNYQSFDLEGDVSKDGDIYMYCEYEANGIQYTNEYEGTISKSGKVTGDVEAELAGISFEGTWSASEGNGTSNNDVNETYTTISAPSSITGTTYRFNTGVITEAQFRANGYGTMYTSVGSFGIKYQYVKKSGTHASVRMWQYYNNEIRDDRYDDFSMSFEDSYSGTCTHTGESAIGKYGPISGTFERIQ